MAPESLILHPTPMALWYSLICEAQKEVSVQLKTELESYLVFLLMRFHQRYEHRQ